MAKVNSDFKSGVPGISRTSLWEAWKEIRKELRRSANRDVVDFLEFDVNPDKWINETLLQIKNGTYQPNVPHRFFLAKSNGFVRQMTTLHIPDLVVYRAIVDRLYRVIKPKEHKHAYFQRATHAKIHSSDKGKSESISKLVDTELSSDPAIIFIGWEDIASYPSTSKRSWEAWFDFEQYKRHLVLDDIHEYIVVTDITNFFDSLLYDRIADILYGLKVSPLLIGLLFNILEQLSVRWPYGESPRIGLPVDEFGCSRKLAHMSLFPHDERMVGKFGTDVYMRWMDDQNIGVASYAEGLRALGSVQGSLGRLHLTPNSKKSKILSLKEAAAHFHFDLNAKIDKVEKESTDFGKIGRLSTRKKRTLRKSVKELWADAIEVRGVGQWEKIYKRILKIAARTESKIFKKTAANNMIAMPDSAIRICEYMRCVCDPEEYINFVEEVRNDPCQVYDSVERVCIESLLRLEPHKKSKPRLTKIASDLLSFPTDTKRWSGAADIAPLLILRFGDKRSLPKLLKAFGDPERIAFKPVTRAASIVYSGYGQKESKKIGALASKLLRNHLAHPVRLLWAIRDYDSVPDRMNRRVQTNFDPVTLKPYIDMRTLVIIRLLALNNKKKVREWLKSKKKSIAKTKRLSVYDQKLIERLWPD